MGGSGCGGRVETDRPGERMGGVDERIHLVRTQPCRKPVGTAEASDTDLSRRKSRTGHPAGEELVTLVPAGSSAISSPARRRASVVPPSIRTCIGSIHE